MLCTQFSYKIHQHTHIFYRCLRQNAVAQIKDVSRPPCSLAQNSFRPDLQFFLVRKQQHGIKIALHRAFKVQTTPGLVERHSPVHAHHLRSGFFHHWKQRGGVGAEVDDRDPGGFEPLDQIGGVGQDRFPVVFHAQAANPAVKHLQHVGSGFHLFGGVRGQHLNQLAHEQRPCRRFVVHHFFGVDVISGAAAFNHVTGQRERRAAKTDHRQRIAEMLHHAPDGFRHIAQLGAARCHQCVHGFLGAHRAFDDWPLAGGEAKGQAHHLQRQQKISEDDGCIHPKLFRGSDGNFRRQLRCFADFKDGVVLADGAILRHVAASLAHEPYRCGIYTFAKAGPDESGIGCGHKIRIYHSRGVLCIRDS